MKKIMNFFLILLITWLICYGEYRRFCYSNNGKCVTVWKTFNNTCYIIPGKYYGLLKPSSINYVQTTNVSSGVNLIWKTESDTLLAQLDSSDQIFNNTHKGIIVNYNKNVKYNDSVYTYFDSKSKIKRYKKGINMISISIDNMGAL